MFFPISNAHISPIYLAVVGFLIGILGGFFGVGGSFIAGPALRLMGVDWNYAVERIWRTSSASRSSRPDNTALWATSISSWDASWLSELLAAPKAAHS